MLDPLSNQLGQYMSLLSVRQQLVASNVANADTPGYKTKDIDFENEFENVASGLQPLVAEVQGLTLKNDGNNVDLDREARKLAEKHRQGARVSKRYHPPETPYERLLQAETLSDAIKAKLREVGIALDPLQLLEEVRAMQSHLVILANGGRLDVPSIQETDLPAFLASLSCAWRAGEVRPTHSEEAHPRYLRPLREVVPLATTATRQLTPQPEPRSQRNKAAIATTVRPSTPQLDVEIERRCELQRQDLARRHIRRIHAFTLVWPLIERRLEGRPNLNASELLDELRVQYPGRFHLGQLAALTRRVNLWREDARARGVVIGKRSNRTSGLPRTWRSRVDPFEAHWPELCEWLATDPDQTGLELFTKLRSKYPDCYTTGQLRTLQRRLKCWRQDAVRRLICEMQDFTQDVGSETARTSSQTYSVEPQLLASAAPDQFSFSASEMGQK